MASDCISQTRLSGRQNGQTNPQSVEPGVSGLGAEDDTFGEIGQQTSSTCRTAYLLVA
jgi:hypothetical protein